MSLEPLNSASAMIQVHAWTAMIALALGVIVLLRQKGNTVHRWMGRGWLVVMLVAVLSSFFIHELRTWGAWSPIHILSVVTLVLLVRAYRAIRRRKVALHAGLMKAAFYNALLLAMFFTFMPGRIMHAVVFGAASQPAPEPAVPLWVWIVGAVLLVGGRRHVAKWLRRSGKTPGASRPGV
ncbi:DUF2306 domain-containing protein [Bordetella petrii]|uniref:DUF2306 domain-containing protein n=1 Tax=Bordetella petrii TaxID=94624 RepID=UPI001A958D40|nr:DUF2306 domain-containing protein [Bordetella petrii]MBO1112438.1 DUF2306 domain-containing protein [Bordetella petrii]